jgi:hypothetical protein
MQYLSHGRRDPRHPLPANPVVGGRWSIYGVSHVVGHVENNPHHPHGMGWTPACDLRMKQWPLRAHGDAGTPIGPSQPTDEHCEFCAQGVQR